MPNDCLHDIDCDRQKTRGLLDRMAEALRHRNFSWCDDDDTCDDPVCSQVPSLLAEYDRLKEASYGE